MSFTAVIWILIFVSLLLASKSRPVYACSAYLMTFFAAPPFWWWGKGALTSLTLRWNLLSAVALVVVVLMHWNQRAQLSKLDKKFFTLLAVFVVNAIIVHNMAAANPIGSLNYLDILWKSAGLSLMIRFCLSDQTDLRIFLFSIVALCGYVGYEVVINHAGRFEHGRLEGIGMPNATGSNGIAAVMSMGLVFSGCFVVSSRSILGMMSALVMAPFILDTVLRCNSRGAYLGLIASGIWLFLSARGPVRKRAGMLLLLGAFGIFLQAGNDKIWERFGTTFNEKEERDNSAAERLLYWEAAVKMIADYPLGKGGKAAFSSNLGATYIAHFRPGEFRSVHNGYLDLAAGWGLQGFAIFMVLLGMSMFALFRATWRHAAMGNYELSFLGATIQAGVVDQLVCTVFTSILDGEWYLWLMACSLAYAQLPIGSEVNGEPSENTIHPTLEPVHAPASVPVAIPRS